MKIYTTNGKRAAGASGANKLANSMTPSPQNKEMKIIRKVPIMQMWFENNDLFIRIKVRAGMYYFPMGDYYAEFLVDVFHNDWKGGRTYKFVGFRPIK